MSGIARKREATTEDLLAFPDSGSPFDRGRGWPGSWWIVDEPELQPVRDVLVPDLAGRRRERHPALPHEAFFSPAPDVGDP